VPAAAALVACPECGSADSLVEHSLRYTSQPVYGLRRDGDAEDYQSFDYGDAVLVQGYGCSCGWLQVADLWSQQLGFLHVRAQQIRDEMKEVPGGGDRA
jgi:hypothetical protein